MTFEGRKHSVMITAVGLICVSSSLWLKKFKALTAKAFESF